MSNLDFQTLDGGGRPILKVPELTLLNKIDNCAGFPHNVSSIKEVLAKQKFV